MTYTNATDLANEAARTLIEEYMLVESITNLEAEGHKEEAFDMVQRYKEVMSWLMELVRQAKELGVYAEVKELVNAKVESLA